MVGCWYFVVYELIDISLMYLNYEIYCIAETGFLREKGKGYSNHTFIERKNNSTPLPYSGLIQREIKKVTEQGKDSLRDLTD